MSLSARTACSMWAGVGACDSTIDAIFYRNNSVVLQRPGASVVRILIALAIFKCAFACALLILVTFGILQPTVRLTSIYYRVPGN
jgi:hypothetical protein